MSSLHTSIALATELRQPAHDALEIPLSDPSSGLPIADRGVRELLAELTLNGACLTSAGDAPLETIGMTSVAMIEFVYLVEDRFSIHITDDEVAPENFASISSVVALVARKCRS